MGKYVLRMQMQCDSKTTVVEWHRKFRSGPQEMSNETGPGQEVMWPPEPWRGGTHRKLEDVGLSAVHPGPVTMCSAPQESVKRPIFGSDKDMKAAVVQ